MRNCLKNSGDAVLVIYILMFKMQYAVLLIRVFKLLGLHIE